MNKFPGVTEILSLLQRLKDAVQDFAAREEKLDQQFRARGGQEMKAYKAVLEEFEQGQADRLSHAEIVAQDELARWQTRYERRKIRINEIHKKLRRSAVDDVANQEGRRKHRLQQSAMEAERRRDSELANSSARLAEFQQRLGTMGESLALLEANARRAFAGFAELKKLLAHERQWPEPDTSPDEHQLFDQLASIESGTGNELAHFRKLGLIRLVRFIPAAWLVGILLAATIGWKFVAPDFRPGGISAVAVLAFFGGLLIARVVLYQLAKANASSRATKIASELARARRLQEVCLYKADQRHQQEQQQIRTDYQNTSNAIDQEYKHLVKDSINLRDQRPRQLDEKAQRATRRHEAFHAAKMPTIERQRSEANGSLMRQGEARRKELADSWAATQAKLKTEQDAAWHALESEWKTAVLPLCETLHQVNDEAQKLFPEWDLSRWQNWNPPEEFKNASKFGRLEVDIEKFASAATRERKLPLPCDSKLKLPLSLTYPREGAILFETGKAGADEALTAINNIIFRLLSVTPPGKLSFTIFDPVGLGQNFAGLMHLADYEASHINSRIWTQTQQMEEKLAELNEHMEKVIQMYLRNEYETIAEYNAQAGSIAEKYHFLVIASFPANFSDTAARRLRNIASSGARCGVYTLIQWDTRQPFPQDFVPDELRKNSVRLIGTERGFEFGTPLPGTKIFLDAPPSPEFATHFLHQVGEASKDANRVEVPFEQIAPSNGEFWSEQTAEELRVPIGRSGATKLQYLAIGKGTRQHALIAGKTGSGKSTLFHVMVTNLALWCSPDQVEFYLVDFKKGVEFKCYAARRLPHGRVVAIESDRQFGLSVLERVDQELRRRGDLFRKLGVQDLAGYKRAGGAEKLPRSLLMIDEFQEFFTEEDRISQGAAVLLDRIVRQGRAFGIHVILGSQTLGGAYTLARATLGQMVIRIALQCNEADAYLIMDQDNPAPRLLSRPGEGIYNDAAGAIEGNSPFQAVWLPEDVRDGYLVKIRASADQNGNSYPGPFVFEGNAPADVRENLVLKQLLADPAAAEPGRPAAGPARIWLGAPNSIKGPTEVAFQRQSGNNLLLVGQNEESTLAMLSVSLVSLATQHPPESARIILMDSTAPGSPQAEFLDRAIQATGRTIFRPRGSAIVDTMTELSEELKRRTGEEETAAGQPIYLIIYGLENFKKLRMEDEFAFSSSSDSDSGPNPAVVLQNLITEGPSHGIHVIITCDTFNNVSRFLGRKTMSEFAMRVLFQMSASDSAALIDAPDASTLGMHRALLYNDREGYMETFRPYARPGNDWFEEVTGSLKPVTA